MKKHFTKKLWLLSLAFTVLLGGEALIAQCDMATPIVVGCEVLEVPGTSVPDGNGAQVATDGDGAVWFSFVAPYAGTLTVTSCNSNPVSDTEVAVHNIGAAADCSLVANPATGENDDGTGCTGFSTLLVMPVIAGDTYAIEWGDQWSNAAFDWEVSIEPDVDVPGCNDPTATNFDPAAICDDGSCMYDCDLMDAGLVVGVCDDGGTPTDPSDDTYTITLDPTGVGLGTTYTVTGGATGAGTYGTPLVIAGNVAGGGNLILTITDDTDTACTLLVSVTDPGSCADCVIEDAGLVVGACENAGTGGDPSDDTYTITLDPTGIVLGTTYTVTGGATGTGTYGTPLVLTGVAGGGNLILTLTDDTDMTCTLLVSVDDPGSCSTCDADTCDDAVTIAVPSVTAGATPDCTFTDQGTCGTGHTAPDIWYEVVGDGSIFSASVCNDATFDTKLSIWEGTCDALVCIGGEDDTAGCAGFTTEEHWYACDGVSYFVMVHGFGTNTGEFNLTMSSSCPTVTTPASGTQTVCDGGEADITDATTGLVIDDPVLSETNNNTGICDAAVSWTDDGMPPAGGNVTDGTGLANMTCALVEVTLTAWLECPIGTFINAGSVTVEVYPAALTTNVVDNSMAACPTDVTVELLAADGTVCEMEAMACAATDDMFTTSFATSPTGMALATAPAACAMPDEVTVTCACIPTVGEWGLLCMTLCFLSLGLIYIREEKGAFVTQ